jgi:hypothetical protein
MSKNTLCKILLVVAGAVQGIASAGYAATILGPVATALGIIAGLFHASPAAIAAANDGVVAK